MRDLITVTVWSLLGERHLLEIPDHISQTHHQMLNVLQLDERNVLKETFTELTRSHFPNELDHQMFNFSRYVYNTRRLHVWLN